MAGLPHRLRRTRPERQADAGGSAARLSDGAGHATAGCSRSPTTRRRSARRSRGRCTASATTARRMQLLYVANRYEKRAEIERWLAGGVDRRLRPLPGVEHRLRRGAGPRSGVAARHPAVSAAAGPDDPARHRARDRGRPQGRRPRSLRARSRAPVARARRATSARHAEGLAALDGERPRTMSPRDVIHAVATRLAPR